VSTEPKVFLNGNYVPESQASVSVFDHGFLYGDGVFEGIRAYHGRLFKLDEHVDRLFDSAKAIDLTVPYSKAQFKELILETCRLNAVKDGYIRPVVSRGPGDLGLDPRKCKAATVLIIARPTISLYPKEKYEKGLTVVTVSARRTPAQCLSPNIKSLNYLNNILGRIEANHVNADEGLMLDVQGFVSEATADNIFLVRRGIVSTPPAHNTLKGITRKAVKEVCAMEGFQVEEHPIALFDVYTAEEVFITGTAAEVVPVVWVDGKIIGDGKPGTVTKHLMAAFSRFARSTGTPIYPDKAEPAPAAKAKVVKA
jgi:branched-chain amino acid aminotransferase